MTGADDGELVSRRRHGHVLIVEMRRERKRNAINRELADAIDEALNELEDDDGLWAGILTHRGPVFSAGSDLTAGGDYVTERGGEYGIVRRPHRTPIIAALEGPALGGGFEIALACDLVVASTDARFGLPEVAIGVVATCAGLFRTPRAFPLNLARELVLTGQPITAERAHAAGFVNVLTEPGGALDAAITLAERIVDNAPLSVQASLAAVNAVLGDVDERGWDETKRAQRAITGTADAAEGVASFLERRPPQWQAR